MRFAVDAPGLTLSGLLPSGLMLFILFSLTAVCGQTGAFLPQRPATLKGCKNMLQTG